MRRQSVRGTVLVEAAMMAIGTVQAQSPKSTDRYHSRRQTADFRMITKQFRITVALLALMAVAPLGESAGQVFRKAPPNKPAVQTYLQCDVSNNLGLLVFVVTNNTSSTIPQGKTIHWSYNYATKGSFTLQNALPPAGKVDRTVQKKDGGKADPKAWFYK